MDGQCFRQSVCEPAGAAAPHRAPWRRYTLGVMFLAASLLCTWGCIAGPAHLLYVLYGHKVSAAYKGLKGQRVAILCVANSSSYGPDTLSDSIGRVVGAKLQQNVKNIKVIPYTDPGQWSGQVWDDHEVHAWGKQLDAQKVVMIEVSRYTIHDGSTMYKGRATVTVSVYNIHSGSDPELVFTRGPHDYEFPTSGRPTIQTSERQFEAIFLAKLTDYIAQLFYDHDSTERVAESASML